MKTHLRKFSRIFIGTVLFFFVGINLSKAQGASVAFNGSNDYIQVSSLTLGNNWTAEAWIYPTSVGGVNWKTVLGQSYWNGLSGFVIAIVSNSVFVEGPQGLHIQTPITANVWTHVAATYNNGIYAFYVNGSLIGVQTGTFTNAPSPFFIGSRNDNNVTNNSSMMDPFAGNIDEVRIWNTTRSECQIKQYMNCEIPTSFSGLEANYHFNQCTGTTLLDILSGSSCSTLNDASGNGYSGTFSSVLLSLSLSPIWSTSGSPAQGLTSPASANTSEIDVTGNGNSIADGSAVPSTTNHTNFNGAITRTFVISNSGTQTLSLGTPVLTGTAASQFSITTLPGSPLAATNGSTSFVVTFNPNTTGVKNATVNIYNLDCSEPFYSFAITATALPAEALDFNGVDDAVTALDPIIGTSDCTIETWFKQTSTNGGYLVSNRSNEGGPAGYWWALSIGGGASVGSVGLEMADAGGIGYRTIATASGLYGLNTWNHVAAVRSGTLLTIYLNGISVLTATETAIRNWDTPYDILHLGGWPEWNGAWFKGVLDETRIWKIARTQCEIQTFMNCEVVATPTTLVANYHFNQGVGAGNNSTLTVLSDASASARTGSLGIIVGATTYSFNLTGTVSNWVEPGSVPSNYTTFTTPNVEIDVRGAGNSIIDGNTSTSPVDLTDFNGATTRTFVIHNINSGVLAIGVPYLTGTDASDFSITTLPSTSLSGVSTTSLVVAFSPTSTGVKSATINIPNSDCDEPVYDFKITATPPAAAALNFDGSTDEVSLPAMNFTSSSVTIEGWFYANGTQLANAGLVFHRGCSTCGLSSGINIAPSDNTKLSYTWADYYGWVGPTYPLNTWFHVALVVDANKAVMYLNGVPYVNPVAHSTQAFAGTTYIGKDAETCCGNRHFNGSVDELRFWNTGRTGCDIQTYMNCEIPTTATNLVANYHFNQGSAGISNSTVTSLIDAAGTHTGTLISFNLSGASSNWISPGGVINGSVTTAAPTSSILVSGNSNSITPGSTSPSTLNLTDFGTAVTRTFVIQNSNTGTLNLSVPYFTGTNASDFSVTVLPSTSIPGSATSSFVVAFTPTSSGVKSATLNIVENSCGTPLFSCAITATTSTAEALNFNGGSQYVELGSNIIELGQGDFTIETWIKTTGNDMGILTCSDGDANWEPGEKCFLIENDGHLEFVGHGCDYIHASQTYSVNDGAWHHIALTWDLQSSPNGVGKIYVDGIDRTASSTYTALTSNLGTFKIGLQNYGESNLNFSGSMDEFRIWNVARSQCEIQSYMQCEITGTLTNLVANYHFNQGAPFLNNTSINTLIDGAATPYTGTLTNFVLTGTVSNWVSPGGVITGSTTPAPPTASILVSGNSNSITPGSTITSTLDFTDFGTASTRTFVIQNSNLGSLNIATPYFTGTNSADFSVTVVPSTSLAASATTSFVITFSPASTGVKNATLNINNNTCSIPIFSCAITATPSTATGLDLSGGANYITATGHTLNGQSFSVEFWAKRYNNTTPDFIFGQGTSTTNNGLHIGFYDQGVGDYFIFDFWNSGLSVNHSDYNWHHWACVYDASTPAGQKNRFIYRDGILVAMDSYTSSYAGSGTSYIGTTPWAPVGDIFTGSLDEMRIWSTARSQCEIETYMNCEIPSTATGLVSNYHFNQGSPGINNSGVTTLIDAAASPHNGTLTSFALTGTVSNWISPSAIALNYSTAVAPTGSFIVSGNGNNVPVGVTTSTTNFTDFGTNTTRTFVVNNPGAGPLYVNTGYLTGANASNFIVTAAPGSVIASGASANLAVTFSPTALGTASAILNVVSSDCTHPTYSFVITATAVPADALAFSGLAEYVALPVMDFSATNKLTFEAWVKPTDITSGAGYFEIMRQDINISNPHWLVSFQDFGTTLSFGLNTSSGGYTELDVPVTPTYFTDGNWHHVAAVYDGSTKRLYVDGTQVGMEVKTGTIVTGAAVHSLGRANYYGEFFNGSMDEVRYWNTARTQCEILSYMNCEISGSPGGLVANYHFTQGIPFGTNTLVTTALDATSANNGTLTSFVLTGSVSNWVSPGGVITGSITPAVLSQTLNVKGNGNTVPIGATTSTNNFTDFSTNSSRSFVAENIGTGTLYINSISFTGTGASQFSVVSAPANSLASSATSSFTILFTPTVVGTSSAVVNVNSSDCSNPNYSFVITASTAPAAALSFDGSNDDIILPLNSAFDFTTGTIEAWININNAGSNGCIASMRNSSTTRWSIHANVSAQNITVYNGSTLASFAAALSTNTWYHVAVVMTSTNMTAYVNGVYAGTSNIGINTGDTGHNLNIGTTNDLASTFEHFNGKMDEMRVWDAARTQCQIQQYMNCEIPTTSTNLLANFHFNQGIPSGSNLAVTTLTDATGVNNATLNSFSLTGSSSNWVSPGGVISGSMTPAAISQTLNVKGNGNTVPIGVTTSTNNFTDFAANTTRVFVAENIGSGPLYINNIYFTGANASNFSVTAAPASSVSGGGNSSFTILFTPTVIGTSSAIVNITSSDCSNPTYSFVITASASPASALHFDGGPGYVDLGPGTNLKPTSALTAEAWVNAGNWPSVDQTFVGNTESNGWGILTQNSTGSLEGYVRRNGSWANITTPLSAIAPGWHHVALTYDGRYTKLYLDGVVKGMDDAGATYTIDYNSFNNTLIGAEASGGSTPVSGWYFTGGIDEVRIWSTARTQCEILTTKDCEIPGTAANLVANYHFNQGLPSGPNATVILLNDAAGSNTGTLTNMALTGSVSNWVAPSIIVNGYTLTNVPTPTLIVTGNSNTITAGSSSTGTNNFTDFGSASTRTFVTHNIASSGTLYISSLSLSGGNASDFTVTALPSTSLTASGSSNFAITFTPTALGTRTAIVSVFSSDCSNPVYSFVITASASPASALDFDNNNDYVNLGTGLTTLFDPLNTITLEAWVNPTSTVGLGSIVGNWQSPVSVMQFLLQRAGNRFCLHVDGGTGYLSLFSAPNTVSLNTWQHVAGVWDGSEMKLYINGVLQGVMTNTGSSFPTRSNNVMIGGNSVNEQLTGSIDEVRVWSVPRTQCEILQYMNCEITSTASGLVANYHFNQGIPGGSNNSYSVAIDATGTYSGTLSGFGLSGATSNWINPGGVISGSITPAVLNQTINLLGNGNAIPIGSSTGTLNFTDFGSSTNRVYTIHNSGTGVLYINPTITISGAGAGDFSLTASPATSISGVGNTSFAVSFIPSSLGTKTAVITIGSSDCTAPVYSFVISASPSSGAALSFDGASGQAAVSLFNTQTTNVTMQAKVFWSGATGGNQSIVYNGNTSTSGYGLYVGTSGDLFMLMGGVGGVPSNYTLTPNQWTYLTMVITSPSVSFYVNGVLTGVGNQNTYGYPNTPAGYLSVGANGGSAEVFNGTIDEVLFWSRPLSQCEIQAYSSCEISGTLTGLEANYHFNQGVASGINSTVTTVTDASGNGHDLTVSSMLLTGPISNWVIPGAVTSGSSCSTYSAPEIAVVGGTTSLSSGDVLPSTAKDTDYGNISTSGNTVHTFTIQNTGNGSLSVSSITMSGADAGSYLVGSLIPSSPIAAGNFAVFNVTFAPSSSGTKTAMVNISNTDCDEALFTYMLTGSGANGQSFVFDGTDDYVTCGNILTASYTKEAWVKIGTSTNGNNFISTGTGVVGSAFWAPGIYSYKLSAGHDGLWNQIQDATALSTNTWYHVAVTYDAPSTTMSLYKNGVLVASSNTVQPYSGSTPLQLGAYAGTYVVNGSMDEVRIWNRALCASEILNNMNCEIQTTASGLVGNYHFNQGIGYGANGTQTMVTDFSGAGNTGTIVNAALSGTTSNWQFTTAVTSGSFCPAISVPEINLIGNGVSIADGKTVSATSDHTDFGSVCINTVMVRTYTVQNTGAGPLSITNMSMSGTSASLFTIGSLSPSSPISPSSSAVFSVTFAPTSAGAKTATIVIGNDDCTESVYDFVLTGTCNALPVVTATASGSVICNGATVTLNGGGANTYTWTGGTPTVTDNVAFTPSTTLSYTVSGTDITTGCTSTNIAVQGITVNPSPTISATVSNSVICAGATTTVFPANAGTYTLLPGPLSGTSIAVSPTITTSYTLTGTSLSGCNGVNNIPITITVNALPTVTANTTNSSVCDGFTTSVYGSGADTYTWTGSVTNSVSFVPTTSQVYTVSGTNTLTGCVSTNIATQSIVVNALPSLTASAINSVICNGNQATLTASGASNYTWLPGPVYGATATVNPSSLTIYTVSGTSTANCTSTNLATQSISVNTLPTVTANISNSIVCEGNSVTLNGSGADTYTWTGGAINGVSFTVSANSTYSVTGTNTLTGCTSTNNAAVTLSVNSLPTISVNISSPAICIGSSVTLSAGGGTSYVWSGTVTDNVAFSPTITADYTVTGTDANACVNNSVITVTVNSLPVLSVITTNSLNCEAQSNTLTVTGASTYSWSGGETTDSIVITPTANTSYTVSGIDINGCAGQLIYTQSVTPCSDTILVSTLLVDESCKGKGNGSVVLSFTTAQQNYQTSYYWSEPTLCPDNNCDSLNNLKAGIYSVKIKITYTLNSILVRSDSTIQNFEIREGSSDCVLKVYNGITRNGDGENEFLYIENIEQYPNNTIKIFTRWGEEVYTMKGYNNIERAWPIEGELSKLSSNTYFYVLDPGEGSKVIKGWIELIKK